MPKKIINSDHFYDFIDRVTAIDGYVTENIFVMPYKADPYIFPQNMNTSVTRLLEIYSNNRESVLQVLKENAGHLINNAKSEEEKSSALEAVWFSVAFGMVSKYECYAGDNIAIIRAQLLRWLIDKKIGGIDTRCSCISVCPQNTALMWLVANGHCAAPIELMSEYDANPALQDDNGKTVLHLLFAKGHFDIKTISERANQWPLVEAILKRDDIVSFINTQDDYGNTALHYACTLGANDKYIKALIKAGADTELLNNARQSPQDILRASEYERLCIRNMALSGSAQQWLQSADAQKQDEAQVQKLRSDIASVATIHNAQSFEVASPYRLSAWRE